ncbi:MAG: hypothetical protein H7330_02875 [Hymenobacteraceae bacterium]|nr:hypothetical protein [Hymenobacteraceae bacterium]
MSPEPLTETDARGKTHQLLDDWLARWPGAHFNNWPAAEARLGFVDSIAPLLAAPDLNLAVEDFFGVLQSSPTAVFVTGDGATPLAVFDEAWRSLTTHRLRRGRLEGKFVQFSVRSIYDVMLCIQTRTDTLTHEELMELMNALEIFLNPYASVIYSTGPQPDLLHPVRITLLGAVSLSSAFSFSRYWYCAYCRHVFDVPTALGVFKVRKLRCPSCGSKYLHHNRQVILLLAAGLSLTSALHRAATDCDMPPPPAEGPLPWGWKVVHSFETPKPVTYGSLAESLKNLRSHLTLAEREGRWEEAAWLREQEAHLVIRIEGLAWKGKN